MYRKMGVCLQNSDQCQNLCATSSDTSQACSSTRVLSLLLCYHTVVQFSCSLLWGSLSLPSCWYRFAVLSIFYCRGLFANFFLDGVAAFQKPMPFSRLIGFLTNCWEKTANDTFQDVTDTFTIHILGTVILDLKEFT